MTTRAERAREERLSAAEFETFEPTADAIRKWVETTDPAPSRESVVAHVNWLRANSAIEEREVESLAVDYPELAGL